MLTAKQLLKSLQAEVQDCQISVYAGNAAFFLALSALPVATLFMGLLQWLPEKTAALLENALQILPEESAILLWQLFTVGDPIAVASVSAIAALWASSRGIYGLTKGLNRAFHLRETRSWLRIRTACMGETLLLLGTLPILLCMTGKLEILLSVEAIRLFALFLTALLLGRALPARRLPFRYLLPGSLFTALSWYAFSALYRYYLHHISPGKLTGGLSNIAVTLLWLYFCMELLFFGAVVCRIINEKIPQD